MHHAPVRHRTVEIDGMRIFLREGGEQGAPAVLLPHGYPCSSYEFRNLIPALADRWHLLAPDFPGFGYSGTPDPSRFGYDFNAYADFLESFLAHEGVGRFVIYLHDYGSQIGLRLAMRMPDRIAGLVIQNGDIYEDVLGPKYEAIRAYWADPSKKNHKVLEDAVSEEGFRHEFVGEVGEDVAALVPPDLWKLHWPLMDTPVRRRLSVGLMEKLEENLSWFPRYQQYLRDNRPPTLIVWGPKDGYMPEPSARAYLRDLPDAGLHLIDGAGHWLLETHFAEAVPLIRGFLERVHVR